MLKVIKEAFLSESVDSVGRELTKEQSNYFRNSKIRDSKGNLLVCYHGSGHKDITTFDMYDKEYQRPKCFFSTVEKYSNEYAYDPDTDEEGVTYQVYLNITNPFDIERQECKELAKQILGEIPSKRKIQDTDKLFNELYKNRNKYGYDGIIAGEELPKKALQQFGNDANISYVPFYPNQIKLVSNKKPTSSDRIDEDLTMSKSISVYRGESESSFSKNNKSYAGLFFGPTRDSVKGWGKVKRYTLNKNAKIYEGKSSDEFTSKYYDKEYPELLEAFGNFISDLKSLNHFLEKSSQGEEKDRVDKLLYPRFCWYDVWTWSTQLVAKIELEKQGYDGALWTNEDFGNPVQYQIWNLDVIKLNEIKSIKESKEDFDKFRIWCGNDPNPNSIDLYPRFIDLKDDGRLKGREKDIYYWMKDNKYDELDNLLTTLENTPTRKEKEDKAREGAKLLYQDSEWEVYYISTYNAAAKYGKNTSWCISGTNTTLEMSGWSYWRDYVHRGDKIYFYINKSKNRKWALVMHKDNNWTLYDDGDWVDVDTTYNYEDELDCWNPYDASQPNFPLVNGLPDINQEYERCKQEIGYYQEL